MEEKWPNNCVELCGVLGGKPEYSHSSRDERYLVFPLVVQRLSGAIDTINIVAREGLLKDLEVKDSEKIIVKGEIRSFNNRTGVGNRLIISVFAKKIEFGCGEDKNNVFIVGVICKPSKLRRTPMGREICDMMLAVNRRYGRSDYIPCISWGQEAEKSSDWQVGTMVSLAGRIQSRNYVKAVDGGSIEKTVFEVSIIEINLTFS